MMPFVPVPDMPTPSLPGWMSIALVVFAVLFAAVVALIVVTLVRNARRAREHGLDPLTMQTDATARFIRDGTGPSSAPGAPSPTGLPGTTEARLRELDDLRSSGVITPDEYASARASALNR